MEKSKITLKSIGKDKLILMALAGIILICCSYFDVKDNVKKSPSSEPVVDNTLENDDYEKGLEIRLKEIIEKMYGIKKAEVMITLKSTNEKILKDDTVSKSKNTSESGDTEKMDLEAENSKNTLVLKKDDGESPYVIKEMMPKIEGIVVVAKGGGDQETAAKLTKMIEALFDVEPHKISIVEMK